MKTALIYVLTIGISFAGLLGVLKAGKGIKAPLDVSGDWNMGKGVLDSLQNSCISFDFKKKNQKINIEQSGIHLTIIFNDEAKTELQGKLENYKMTFSKLLPTKDEVKNNCGNETELKLIVEVQRKKNKPDILSGIWSTPKCSNCSQFHFSAVKKKNKYPEEE